MPRRGKKSSPDKDKKEEPTIHYTGRLRTIDAKHSRSMRRIRSHAHLPDQRCDQKTGGSCGRRLPCYRSERGRERLLRRGIRNETDPPPGEEPAPSAKVDAPGEPAPAPESGVNLQKGPKYDVGDEGAPKLKRGKPVEHAKAKPVESDTVASVAAPAASSMATAPVSEAPATDARAAFVEEARAAATGFLASLPNFVCCSTPRAL